MSVILPEFRVENNGFVSAQSLFRIDFSIYLLVVRFKKPEDHWFCIAHLSAEDMLKSAVIEKKTFNIFEPD